eukprot:m.366366 g.366366  ORF g.366366 m.366366 type:complete len:87 (-) comp35738_c0_seq1:82-342(-)
MDMIVSRYTQKKYPQQQRLKCIDCDITRSNAQSALQQDYTSVTMHYDTLLWIKSMIAALLGSQQPGPQKDVTLCFSVGLVAQQRPD